MPMTKLVTPLPDRVMQAHLGLLDLTRALARTAFPGLAGFLGETLDDLGAPEPAPPRPSVMGAALAACRSLAAPETQTVTDWVIDYADCFAWQQSYSAADGIGADFLAAYGWFNLVSPVGPFRSDRLRITIGYWGPGILYPEHCHEPAEVYAVLAGAARFRSPGLPPRRLGAGESVRHAAWQVHATDLDPGPLLALIPWRGGDLMARATLGLPPS